MTNITIPKESINTLSFLKHDVLETEESKTIRAHMLKKAERLGNAYKGKVKIFFKTIDSLSKSVETTVWQTTGDFVMLKGGVFLPIRAIEKVTFD